MNPLQKALKGYKGRDPISHRKSNLSVQYRRFKSGTLTFRGKGSLQGSGHKAGEEWGEKKQIDANSPARRYSKNSPSFDEGVWQYKTKSRAKALLNSKGI